MNLWYQIFASRELQKHPDIKISLTNYFLLHIMKIENRQRIMHGLKSFGILGLDLLVLYPCYLTWNKIASAWHFEFNSGWDFSGDRICLVFCWIFSMYPKNPISVFWFWLASFYKVFFSLRKTQLKLKNPQYMGI